MLRIGKNPKESAESEISPEKPEVSLYNTPKSLSSFQEQPNVDPRPTQVETPSRRPGEQ